MLSPAAAIGDATDGGDDDDELMNAETVVACRLNLDCGCVGVSDVVDGAVLWWCVSLQNYQFWAESRGIQRRMASWCY